jgi:GNAT superfamily N-acetyltransferase
MACPNMQPFQATDPYDWAGLLRLIQTCFAYMEGVIDPPSSMHALTPQTLSAQAHSAEVWVVGTPAIACAFLTAKGDALYIGKLCIAKAHRGQGLLRDLLRCAETRARALGLGDLELQTRVELVQNQAIFTAMGFVETARTAHAGFARPTSITYRRPVSSMPRR